MLSQRTHMYARIDFISSSDIPPSELAGLLLFLNKIEYFFQAAIHYQNWHKLKSLLTAACGVSSVIKQHKCRCKQMVLVLTFGSPSWTRTNDPAVNSRMLYQLSYWGISSGSAIRRCRRWVIFPGRRQPSIVTVNELNYCVRNGNRCTLVTINTYFWRFTPSKLNNLTRNRYSSSRLHLIL